MKKSILKDKSFAFAVRIVNLYKYQIEKNKEYVISKQLLRSGTSIGANVREAFNGESSKDFVHKLAIAQKECDETLYWLELLLVTNYLTDELFDSISKDAIELMKIITKSILTTKSKLQSKPPNLN